MSLRPFQSLIGGLDYPMYIVTAAADDERSGCLVGFVSQCSLEPARLLVCVSQANHTHGVALESKGLAVHFPRGDDLGLARLFGEETGDATDKFVRCQWHEGPHGLPILDDVRGWTVGTVLDHHSAGDHTAFLVEPTDSALVNDGYQPLMFQQTRDFDPGHPA